MKKKRKRQCIYKKEKRSIVKYFSCAFAFFFLCTYKLCCAVGWYAGVWGGFGGGLCRGDARCARAGDGGGDSWHVLFSGVKVEGKKGEERKKKNVSSMPSLDGKGTAGVR